MSTPRSLGPVDHVALTVTDPAVSQTFYVDVLGFVAVMQVPGARFCMHPVTGFLLALVTHDDAPGGPFSERNTGVDHLAFEVASRDQLDAWEEHLASSGVRYTPTRDETFGSHLNFRDPDEIALELTWSNDLMRSAQAVLASGRTDAAEVAAFVTEHVGPEFVPAPGGSR